MIKMLDVTKIYLDSSKLCIVPDFCHQHAEELVQECRLFEEKVRALKSLTNKIAGDMTEEGLCVENLRAESMTLSEALCDGGSARLVEQRSNFERKIRDREIVVQRLEDKIETLELKETQLALRDV